MASTKISENLTIENEVKNARKIRTSSEGNYRKCFASNKAARFQLVKLQQGIESVAASQLAEIRKEEIRMTKAMERLQRDKEKVMKNRMARQDRLTKSMAEAEAQRLGLSCNSDTLIELNELNELNDVNENQNAGESDRQGERRTSLPALKLRSHQDFMRPCKDRKVESLFDHASYYGLGHHSDRDPDSHHGSCHSPQSGPTKTAWKSPRESLISHQPPTRHKKFSSKFKEVVPFYLQRNYDSYHADSDASLKKQNSCSSLEWDDASSDVPSWNRKKTKCDGKKSNKKASAPSEKRERRESMDLTALKQKSSVGLTELEQFVRRHSKQLNHVDSMEMANLLTLDHKRRQIQLQQAQRDAKNTDFRRLLKDAPSRAFDFMQSNSSLKKLNQIQTAQQPVQASIQPTPREESSAPVDDAKDDAKDGVQLPAIEAGVRMGTDAGALLPMLMGANTRQVSTGQIRRGGTSSSTLRAKNDKMIAERRKREEQKKADKENPDKKKQRSKEEEANSEAEIGEKAAAKKRKDSIAAYNAQSSVLERQEMTDRFRNRRSSAHMATRAFNKHDTTPNNMWRRRMKDINKLVQLRRLLDSSTKLADIGAAIEAMPSSSRLSLNSSSRQTLGPGNSSRQTLGPGTGTQLTKYTEEEVREMILEIICSNDDGQVYPAYRPNANAPDNNNTNNNNSTADDEDFHKLYKCRYLRISDMNWDSLKESIVAVLSSKLNIQPPATPSHHHAKI